ncbi:MAG: type I-U CRISPR-associated helicase/endonuclease Cas3 [Acetobacteraceae bacterium]
MTPSIEDFPAFFQAVHGVTPFPWQERLARQVAGEGWPSALDVPTGCGKTAAIDVAVFALALQAHLPIGERRAPLRIAFVVDRRLVVDDAFERARRLAQALASAGTDGVVARVANALRHLAEEGASPLAVARLRGGLPHEPDWARTPTQPTVLVSTVDQVGSRLLFRGYGVSDSMKPVHAGLLGRDTLVLLDEAHLSQPFLQTLRDLCAPPWGGTLVAAPFHVVPMTATPSGGEHFRLGEDDRADTALARRLGNCKPAALVDVKRDGLEAACVEQARRMTKPAQVIGIVVNRVRRARAIFEQLRAVMGETADTALLIGRTRDVAREDVLSELLPRMRAGRTSGSERPLFVVATQCIEAGADLDFDGLITEIAPLDCLRQRFGRLNRLGRHDVAPAVILAASDQVSARAVDPIYGTALRDTWAFLKGLGTPTVDFGIEASAAWLPDDETLRRLLAPRADAPLLLPRDVRLWAQTAPLPAADPAVPLYLHGPDASPADVQIVWRKELDGFVGDNGRPADGQDPWAEWIEACPPLPGETMPVPIAEARRWLRGTATGDVADVEGRTTETDATNGRRGSEAAPAGHRIAFRIWRNGEVIDNQRLRPGDTVLVPCTVGGADRWGWHPASTQPVDDLADQAMYRTGRQRILRLIAPSIVDAAMLTGYAEMSDTAIRRDLHERGVLDTDQGKVIRSRAGTPLAVVLVAPDAASEDDRSSLTAHRPRRLDEHTDGVVAMVEHFLARLGAETAVRRDILLAARLHDVGKAHPAFQRYLHGGDELAAAAGAVLAKSGRVLTRIHRQRAGLPDGARHEVASLRVAEAHPDFAEAHDPERVLWLIGTHHGQGRPLFPPVGWPQAGDIFSADAGGEHGAVTARPALSAPALTAAWLALHDAVTRRYGPWHLAYLEAVLRLADHRQSERERGE